MSDDVSEEIKEAYRTAILFPAPSMIRTLCNWARHERVMREKAEWQYTHDKQQDSCAIGRGYGFEDCDTPERHKWTYTQWERLIDEELK